MAQSWTLIDRRYEFGASCLGPEDSCFYYMDYTDGGYQESDANQKIFNFKKPLSRRGLADWHYKEDAGNDFANDLTEFLDRSAFLREQTVLVPMPTSKRSDSSEFDDRLIKVVARAAQATGIGWMNLFDVRQDTVPAHYGGPRNVDAIRENLVLNYPTSALLQFKVFLLVDDIITSGAHYIACKELLAEAVPVAQIAGIFWAKRQS